MQILSCIVPINNDDVLIKRLDGHTVALYNVSAKKFLSPRDHSAVEVMEKAYAWEWLVCEVGSDNALYFKTHTGSWLSVDGIWITQQGHDSRHGFSVRFNSSGLYCGVVTRGNRFVGCNAINQVVAVAQALKSWEEWIIIVDPVKNCEDGRPVLGFPFKGNLSESSSA